MTAYNAPLADMRFVLDEIAGLPEIAALPGFESATPDLVEAVLTEAAKLSANVLAPLNQSGDREGSRLENGVVTTPQGFKEAYAQYVAGGWNALPISTDHGGQGLPWTVATAVFEMWTSANMAFSLCPMLSMGAVEMLITFGTPELQRLYLPKLIAGEWTGTMNLTEPQAGSDVGALRTKAVKDGDHYRITGQKIFITYGEHDLAENIVHLVLARLPDAPSGSRGISLFLVPKFLANADGSLGARNDVHCVAVEHKMGIHASPTCGLSYGDDGGAIGFLLGEENDGLKCMFTMMNNARFNVGLEGVAIGERAYQQARDYARERIQGKPIGAKSDTPLPIIHHPDVRRMLIEMRAETEARRALAYYAAGLTDRAHAAAEGPERDALQYRVDLLIPVVKAWCTDGGVSIASTGMQIHGGTGFIETTGAAQHLRDARIAPIYEGTNGIQALDLVGRKLQRDGGATLTALIAEMRALDSELAAGPGDDIAVIRERLTAGIDALGAATASLLQNAMQDPLRALAGATAYLDLLGITVGGWLMARAALAATRRLAERSGDAGFNQAKVMTARFFAEQRLPHTAALAVAVGGGATVVAFDPDLF